MTKAIFFDLDGTILDTVPDIQDSINRMLAENGLPPLSAEEIVQHYFSNTTVGYYGV